MKDWRRKYKNSKQSLTLFIIILFAGFPDASSSPPPPYGKYHNPREKRCKLELFRLISRIIANISLNFATAYILRNDVQNDVWWVLINDNQLLKGLLPARWLPFKQKYVKFIIVNHLSTYLTLYGTMR